MKTNLPLLHRLPSEAAWCRGVTVCAGALMLSVLASVGTLARAQSSTVVQPSAAQAQNSYDIAVARCNAGGLSTGLRGECLANARTAFDLALRGQTPATDTRTSLDGRANIVPPASVPMRSATPRDPDASTTGTTSADGRATVIPPTAISQ